MSGRIPIRAEGGFTLVELLTALGLLAIVLGLAVVPMRSFWFAQALDGAADTIVTQLREQQQDAVSEAHPRVFGAIFVEGASQWTLVRYDPDPDPGVTGEPAVCTRESRDLQGGPFSAAVRVKTVAVTNDTSSAEYTTCASGGEKVIFFYARGTSTGGTVVIEQPQSAREKTITVSVATGRVTRS